MQMRTRYTAPKQGVQFYLDYAHNRHVAYHRHGPQRPVNLFPRFVVPVAQWACGNQRELDRLNQSLQRIDPAFLVIYDPLTTAGLAPGHHLYRITRRHGVDFLTLEFSLQFDIAGRWPHGKPRAPGPWLLDTVRANLKNKDSRTVKAEHFADAEARWAREAKEEAELERFYYKEVFEPVLVRQKVQSGYGAGRGTTVRFNPGAKTRVAMSGTGGNYQRARG